MSLAALQAEFHALVTGEAPAPARAAALVAGTPALGAADRLGLYAGMYATRLLEALRADFPGLAALLGPARFSALGEAYARAHPSEHHDLGRFGRELAAFLRRHPGGERPDLADLAALEWARSEVFVEAEVAPVTAGAFAALAPEGCGAARLALAPALRVLALEHQVLPLWRALEEGAPPPPASPAASAAAVWRSGLEVAHAALPLDEAQALRAAAAGAPLAEVCAAFAERPDPAAAAFAALGSWAAEGWVVGVA